MKQLDLMQVHNLVDLEAQLATMRAWKDEGRVRAGSGRLPDAKMRARMVELVGGG